jgi:hypothetical protein
MGVRSGSILVQCQRIHREESVDAYSAQIKIYPLHIEINFGGKVLFQREKATKQKCVQC